MINRNQASISKFIIHKVGNKHNDTKNAFSHKEVHFDEDSYELMLPFLLRPFGTVVQSYRFNHHANVDLNEINAYSKNIFEDDDAFIETSKTATKTSPVFICAESLCSYRCFTMFFEVSIKKW